VLLAQARGAFPLNTSKRLWDYRSIMADFETIVYEKRGAIATLTMNRPERLNGMTNLMPLETGRALAAAAPTGLRTLN